MSVHQCAPFLLCKHHTTGSCQWPMKSFTHSVNLTFTQCRVLPHNNKLNKCECETTESNKNVNEWVPVSTSVFIAPQSHISPMFACAPWHATAQVVPVWGCPGHVRCPPGSCRLPQASAVSFTATNLLEVGCVGVQGGYGMCLFYKCVYACV